jgi:hypothetical protein
MSLKIDKELYKQAQEYYRQWNEEKAEARVAATADWTPAELWQQYKALWHSGWRLCPEPHEWAWREKAESLDLYYERIRKLEAWRRERAK